jgi:hypothetical protein
MAAERGVLIRQHRLAKAIGIGNLPFCGLILSVTIPRETGGEDFSYARVVRSRSLRRFSSPCCLVLLGMHCWGHGSVLNPFACETPSRLADDSLGVPKLEVMALVAQLKSLGWPLDAAAIGWQLVKGGGS